MLNKQTLDDLSVAVTRIIPETKVMLEKRTKLITFITDTLPGLIFTPKDLEIRDKYPDRVRFQGDFEIFQKYSWGQDPEGIKPYTRLNGSYGYNPVIKYRPGLKPYNWYEIDDTAFRPGTLYMASELTELSKTYPEAYKKLKTVANNYLSTREKGIDKYKKIMGVLESPEMTLTMIKNNFKTLYDELKNYETEQKAQ